VYGIAAGAEANASGGPRRGL